jgi:endonuclease/exonuclease/phosphatase family metal-dependent hydrolase
MINHWPSRRGGVLAGEFIRKGLAVMIRNFVDSLFTASSGSSKIIIMGDFNCRPDDPVIQLLINNSYNNSHNLTNLADQPEFRDAGTYRYQGVWEFLDQVIISENLLDSADRLYTETGSFRIFKADFLMTNDIKYPGLSPYATYRGYRYQGGFSDHLPVLLNLGVR